MTTVWDLGDTEMDGHVGGLTAQEILAIIISIDGEGSGIDADYLRGHAPEYFATSNHTHASLYEPINTNIQAHIANKLNPHEVSASQILPGFTGNALKFLRLAASETALEWVDPFPSKTNNAGKVLTVNAAEDGFELKTPEKLETFRNLFRNANFEINQRNISYSGSIPYSGAGTFIKDSWRLYINSAVTGHTQETDTNIPPPYLGIGITPSVVGANTVYSFLAQGIPLDKKLIDLSNSDVSVSIEAVFSGYFPTSIDVLALSIGVSVDGSEPGASAHACSFRLSGSNPYPKPVTMTETFKFPDLSNLLSSITSNGKIVFYLWFCSNAATDSSSGYLGYPMGTTTDSKAKIFIKSIQLEAGEPTAFEPIPYDIDLLRCKRYYQRIYPGASGRYGMARNSTTLLAQGIIPLSPALAAAPTAIETTGTATDYSIGYLATSQVCNAVPTFVAGSPQNIRLQFSGATAMTAGQGSEMIAATAASYIGVSVDI